MPNRPRRLISEHGPIAYTDRPFDPRRACQQSCCRVAYLTARFDAADEALADRILAGA